MEQEATKAKPTAGPWHTGCMEHNWRSIFGPEGCGRAHMETGKGTVLYPIGWVVRDGHLPEEVDRANARLMAAAPDLLEVVKAFLRAPHIGSSGPGSSTLEVTTFNLDAARAAIAKAINA